AIAASSATKIYVCNLMTQANESLGRSAADHIRALDSHAQTSIFDYALLNRAPISSQLRAKYALEGAAQVATDEEAIKELGVIPVIGDYLDEGEVARHATDRIARDLLELAVQARSQERSISPRHATSAQNI
ncbi:MAG: 2-phospho-L-lactate transferase CofD family protein, partial [Terriglobales bacterium]